MLAELGTEVSGLGPAEAAERLRRDGPNVLAGKRHHGAVRLLGRQFVDPIVVLLVAAALLSIILRDVIDAVIILAIIALSSLLGFVQEHRAGRAVEELTALVRVRANLRRGGRTVHVPLEDVVSGDIVELNVGDLIPCDCRLLSADDLMVLTSVLGVSAADEEARSRILGVYERLSASGLRVLGVATRPMPHSDTCEIEDETNLRFVGFLTFADPLKPHVAEAIARLRGTGVQLRIITGDNRLTAAHVAEQVGLVPVIVRTGADLAKTPDAELPAAAWDVNVYAEVTPTDKERMLDALRASGVTVGYLGDGINDAGALAHADVGISVDTAVDVAKQTAAIVLLDKQLDVLTEGVQLGRQTFTNTLKYVQTTVSASSATWRRWRRRQPSCRSFRCCRARSCCSTSSPTCPAPPSRPTPWTPSSACAHSIGTSVWFATS